MEMIERDVYRMPERFAVASDVAAGIVRIQDLETRRNAVVAAAAYGEVRNVLGALFDGEIEGFSNFEPEIPLSIVNPEVMPAAAKTRPPERLSSHENMLLGNDDIIHGSVYTLIKTPEGEYKIEMEGEDVGTVRLDKGKIVVIPDNTDPTIHASMDSMDIRLQVLFERVFKKTLTK